MNPLTIHDNIINKTWFSFRNTIRHISEPKMIHDMDLTAMDGYDFYFDKEEGSLYVSPKGGLTVRVFKSRVEDVNVKHDKIIIKYSDSIVSMTPHMLDELLWRV